MKYGLEGKKNNTALSNEVYIKDNEVCKVYDFNDPFKKIYGNQEQLVLSLLKRKFKGQDYNVLCMEYFPHKPFITEKMTNDQIERLSGLVYKFHNIPEIGRKIPFKKLGSLLKTQGGLLSDEDNAKVKLALKYLKKDKVFCHGDIVDGNILIGKDNKMTLIDFEYSGMANRLGDIASFVTERQISKKQEEMFIKSYYNYAKNFDIEFNKEQYEVIKGFAYIFGYKGALYKFEESKKLVYKEIAEGKLKAIKKYS